MPHDKFGNKLKVGDEVILRLRIKAITSDSETQCNVNAEAVERPEGEGYIPSFAGNSRFYELAGPWGIASATEAARKALELCYAIEEAGASPELTKCSGLASALRQTIADLAASELPPEQVDVTPEILAAMAGQMYTAYCAAVGGVAFNGDPLPAWDEFLADPSKSKQSSAWLAAAKATIA